MAKILALIDGRRARHRSALCRGCALDLLGWLPAASLSQVSTCSIPTHGRNVDTGSGGFVQGRTVRLCWHACCGPAARSASATDIADYAAWTLERLHAARRISYGPPSALTTGAGRGPGSGGNPLRGQGEARGPCAMLSRVQTFSAARRRRRLLPPRCRRAASRRPVARVGSLPPRCRARNPPPVRRLERDSRSKFDLRSSLKGGPVAVRPVRNAR